MKEKPKELKGRSFKRVSKGQKAREARRYRQHQTTGVVIRVK